MRLNITLEIPEKACHDLLTTGYESGHSDFWLSSYDPKANRRGGEAQPGLEHLDVVEIELLTPSGDQDTEISVASKAHSLGAKEIGEAIATVLNNPKIAPGVAQDLQNNIDDLGACDAETADVLMQLACFGEVVYG